MSNFLIIPRLENIEKSIALAEEYGFGFEYNDFFAPNILDDKNTLEKMIRCCRSAGLPNRCTMHGAFLDVLVFSEDRAVKECSEKRVFQSIEVAKSIGAEAVVFHTNHNPLLTAESYCENWFERNEIFWRKVLEKNCDIAVYMENMFDDSPYMISRLAEKLSDCRNFGVCFDYAHAVSFGRNTAIDTWVKTLAPYVRHLHINDNNLKDDLHLAVGSGMIDWEQFAQYYSEYFGGCTVLIETVGIEAQKSSAEFLTNIGIL